MLGDLALSLALCIPKACSVEDVMSSLATVSPVPFSYTEHFCRLPDDKPFSAADYVAVWVLIDIPSNLIKYSEDFPTFKMHKIIELPDASSRLIVVVV